MFVLQYSQEFVIQGFVHFDTFEYLWVFDGLPVLRAAFETKLLIGTRIQTENSYPYINANRFTRATARTWTRCSPVPLCVAATRPRSPVPFLTWARRSARGSRRECSCASWATRPFLAPASEPPSGAPAGGTACCWPRPLATARSARQTIPQTIRPMRPAHGHSRFPPVCYSFELSLLLLIWLLFWFQYIQIYEYIVFLTFLYFNVPL